MSVVISPSFEGKIMALQLYRRYRKECEAGGGGRLPKRTV